MAKLNRKKTQGLILIVSTLLITALLLVPTIAGSDIIGGNKKKVTCNGNADFDAITGSDLLNVQCLTEDSCGLLFNSAPLSLFGTVFGGDLTVELNSGGQKTSKTFTNVGPLEKPEFKLSACVPETTTSAIIILKEEDGSISDSQTVNL